MKINIRKISSKPYKQWCKARKLDYKEYMKQFPLVWFLLTGEKA
jgi:hypothetical protein